MHELPRSFNILSIRQQIMYTRPCHLVFPLEASWKWQNLVLFSWWCKLKTLITSTFLLCSDFKLGICRSSFGLLEFSVFLRLPRLPPISGLHKCCKLHIAPLLKMLHTAKMHKTLLHWREDLYYKVVPRCDNTKLCHALYYDNKIEEICNCTTLQC